MTSPSRAARTHEVVAVIEDEKVRSCPKPQKRTRKPKNPPIDKRAVLLGRFGREIYLPCECGCGAFGHDLHHAFIGRRKGYPILDDDRNLILVNHDEHIARKFDNRESRLMFWNKQVKRFGLMSMIDWVNCLPEKMRSRIDWL